MDRGEDLGEDAIGIGHVVEGPGRPDQVHGVNDWPRRVQVGLDGADPVFHAEFAGLGLAAGQQLRGLVQGDHIGFGEALDQGEGAGTGSATQVEDPAAGQLSGPLVNPGGHLR